MPDNILNNAQRSLPEREDILGRLSWEEKAALLTGADFWQSRTYPHHGIPAIFFADGPHGVRRQVSASDHLGILESQPATCFPPSATIANSWDVRLCQDIGTALGTEAAHQQVDVLLGPGLNIKRSPLCGRNFEYFSEDPYLSGKLAAAYVNGIQSQGVSACPKHFAVNSQETIRMASDSLVDERALREIYLTAFEMVVKEAAPHCLMTSYNKVNGSYANENQQLLTDILRKEWAFDGLVVTDWGGSNQQVAAVKAGAGLEMPGGFYTSAIEVLDALRQGQLSQEDINKRVWDVIKTALRPRQKQHLDVEAHHHLARRAATQSMVLLKNQGDILPLAGDARLAIIGDLANNPRYQGAGSSFVKPTRLDNFVAEAQKAGLPNTGYAQGYHRNDQPDEALLHRAVSLVKQSDLALVFLGLSESLESEGMDRSSLDLPDNQLLLIERLAQTGKPLVAVLSAGAPITMTWAKHFQAILHGYLGGQAGASAMLDIVTGKACPSGKLAETFPLALADTPAAPWYPSHSPNAMYKESIFVGYRYYQKVQQAVCYPFGFGLSYTTFAYDDLQVSKDSVSFAITNTGKRAGAEIAQVYISLADSQVFRPEKELKGFAKVYLMPGERKTVTIPLDDKAFRCYDVQEKAWAVEAGSYSIAVGASSADIRLRGSLMIAGTKGSVPDQKALLPNYFSGRIHQVDDREFAVLLGRPLPGNAWPATISKNMPLRQLQHDDGWLARLLFRILENRRIAKEKSGTPDLESMFIYNLPYRGMAKLTRGQVGPGMVDGLLLALNGHFFRGFGRFVFGYFQNKSANRSYARLLQQQADKVEGV